MSLMTIATQLSPSTTAAAGRLAAGLEGLDVSATRSALAWSPPVSLDEGLTRTAAGFLSETRL